MEEMNAILKANHGVVHTGCNWLFQGWINPKSNIGCVRLIAAVRDNTVFYLT